MDPLNAEEMKQALRINHEAHVRSHWRWARDPECMWCQEGWEELLEKAAEVVGRRG